MSTSRRIELVAVVAIVLALVGSVVAYAMGVGTTDSSAGHAMAYEETLFDTSRVHTIDIVTDDWDGFIEDCENEEYVNCAVVVDGESYKNVAMRAKGNTSLSSVSSMGSDRYSFKIEFDHYNDGTTYHGLDKLSLNNIIQDNTYMKDYLTYTLMRSFGVDAPLACYVYITINGEDWGLYLAVEGVEDSFLERNYGTETGDLYKPDSMGMGGGRGNGREFNMDEVLEELEQESESEEAESDETKSGETKQGAETSEASESGAADKGSEADQSSEANKNGGSQEKPDMGGNFAFGGMGGGGMGSADVRLQYIDDDPDSYSSIFNNAKTTVTEADKTRLIESLKKLSAGEDLEDVLDMEEVLRYFVVHDFVCNGDSYTGTMVHNYYLHESDGKLSMIPWDYNLAFGGFTGGDATSLVNSPIDDPTASGFGGMGGFGGGKNRSETEGSESSEGSVNSEDSSASEDPSVPEGDQSMPQMPEGFDMSQMPDGSGMPQMGEGMEMPDGMEMPNGMTPPSGFGGDFDGSQMPQGMPGQTENDQSAEGQSTDEQSEQPNAQRPDASQMPSFSGSGFGSSDDRPMVDWIFSDESYTARYHELYQEFLDSYDLAAIIDETEALIADYVDKDPTKFCTTEEFEAGVAALKEFCTLRAESVQGQLDGTIPSTEEGQREDSSALVDASSLTISDMGSMGNTMGNGGGPGGGGPDNGGGPGGGSDSEAPSSGESGTGDTTSGESDNSANNGESGGFTPPDMGDFDPSNMDGSAPGGEGSFDPRSGSTTTGMPSIGDLATLAACGVILALGFGVAWLFRRQ